MVELDKFIKIFEGLTSAYGQTVKTDQFSEKGKHKTKSFTISNPVTKKLWREHLEGKDPALGIVPINKENKWFTSIVDNGTELLSDNVLNDSISFQGLGYSTNIEDI